MSELHASIEINRPAADVFSYMINADNLSQWMTELVEAKQTSPGPAGLGTKMSVVVNILGRRIDNVIEITEFEQNAKFAIKASSGPLLNEDVFKLEPVNGGTKVTRNAKVEFGGLFKMAEPLVVRQLNRQFETNFVNLKDLLEAQS
jgi:carbon monoxide dehydrogenase subunit G